MNAEQNTRLVEEFHAAGNRGDIEHCPAMLSDDVCWTVMGSTKYPGRHVGKDTIIRTLIGPLFAQLKSGIRSSMDRLIDDANFVVAQTLGAAETKDGRRYDNAYCHIFRIETGRITEVVEDLDTELTNTVLGR
jgi:uncharacterized protein